MPRIRNFNVAVKEIDQRVLFLRKLVAGGSQHSFGIHVARMAGMPRSIVERAGDILSQLEAKHIDGHPAHADAPTRPARAATADIRNDRVQLSIFETFDPRIGKIKEILLDMEVNTMTPVECLVKLNELKRLAQSAGKDE